MLRTVDAQRDYSVGGGAPALVAPVEASPPTPLPSAAPAEEVAAQPVADLAPRLRRRQRPLTDEEKLEAKRARKEAGARYLGDGEWVIMDSQGRSVRW